jgi:hypothetical protein
MFCVLAMRLFLVLPSATYLQKSQYVNWWYYLDLIMLQRFFIEIILSWS